MKKFAAILTAAVLAFTNGSTFYIPKKLSESTWPVTSGTNTLFGVNMGTVFTAGGFSDVFMRGSDGRINVYISVDNADPVVITDAACSADYTGKSVSVGLCMNRTVAENALPGLFTTGSSMYLPLTGSYTYSHSSSSDSSN